MKKILLISALLLAATAVFAQSPIQNALSRFTDPEKGHTVFIEKGHYALGLSGGYRSFSAAGDGAGNGYAILSILNIGDGKFAMYNVAPSFSYFLADDLSLGLRLDYSGYTLDTDIRANLNEWINLGFDEEASDPESAEMQDMLKDALNVRISGRHMVRNSWGGSLALRKYLSFFGSKTFAVFGEARLYGNYGRVLSCPISEEGVYNQKKMRTSDIYSTGLKLGAGLCVKLRDNSAFFIGLPIVGASYDYTKQHKAQGSNAHMSQFNISRDIDFMAIQVGYTRYIKSKKN